MAETGASRGFTAAVTVIAAVAVAAIAPSPVRSADVAGPAQVEVNARVFVEVQADGRQCVVGKARLACVDTLSYLRDTLGLAAGSRVGVRAHNAAPYRQVKVVLDLLRSSEFAPPVLTVKEPAGTQPR